MQGTDMSLCSEMACLKDSKKGTWADQGCRRVVGNEVREAVNPVHTLPHSEWERPYFFMEKGLVCSVWFKLGQLATHLTSHLNLHALRILSSWVLELLHLSINSLYLLYFARRSNLRDCIYSLLY